MKPTVDPAVFRDKIVFVGTTAAGLHDVFETPFANGKMPGINIHAAVADDISLEPLHSTRPTDARARRDRADAALAAGIVATACARVVGDGGHARGHRCDGLGRDAAVRRGPLAEPVAAGARFVGRAVRRRRVTSTSSRGARSGR